MYLSIVIPTLNEERYILRILNYLRRHTDPKSCEIILCDGGSSDQTVALARNFGCITILDQLPACRAIQMNHGAMKARGEVLYFVHADVLPPDSFYSDIKSNYQAGHLFGMYRQTFEGGSFLLNINSFFTRFDFEWTRGGDQTLYVQKKLFDELNGYDETMVIMEEYELLRRLRKKSKLRIMPNYTLVSTRKYTTNSYWRVLLANRNAFKMFLKNENPDKILRTYKSFLYPY
ncbi:MAG: TIGR04283 family arsenosugar biosynthesis glycosyltransferase [Saprospiraceae bacterium]|nr:TIGR04283 family arsenosugar biosynthesis glycosyltransferase [Saprospiraceae bacterium]